MLVPTLRAFAVLLAALTACIMEFEVQTLWQPPNRRLGQSVVSGYFDGSIVGLLKAQSDAQPKPEPRCQQLGRQKTTKKHKDLTFWF